MKNNTNIYDVDGEIIRAAGDNHRFTIEEAQNRIKYYRDKIEKSEDLQKSKVYNDYITHLSAYVWQEMQKMTPEELKALFASQAPQKTSEDEVKNALKEVENDIETGENIGDKIPETVSGNNEDNTDKELRNDEVIERNVSNIHEERPVSQSDLLVERNDVNTVMDEYVEPIEEV